MTENTPSLTQSLDSVAQMRSMTQEERAALAYQRTQAMLQNPTREAVAQLLPHRLEDLDALINVPNWEEPESIADISGWALRNALPLSEQLLDLASQGIDATTHVEMEKFEKALKARMKPLYKRQKEISNLALGKNESLFTKALEALMFWKKNDDAPKTELEQMEEEFSADAKMMNGIVKETQADAVRLFNIIEVNKGAPKQIAEQIAVALNAQNEALEDVFIGLVAMSIFSKKMTGEVIPGLQQQMTATGGLSADALKIEQAHNVQRFAEKEVTNLMTAFLNNSMQRSMTQEMQGMNIEAAMDIASLGSSGLSQLLNQLSMQLAQNTMGGMLALNKAAYKLLGNAQERTAAGFESVLKLARETQEARLNVSIKTIDAAKRTGKAIASYQKYRTSASAREMALQEQLAKQTAALTQKIQEINDERATQITGKTAPEKRIDGTPAASERPAIEAAPARSNRIEAMLAKRTAAAGTPANDKVS